MSEPIRPWTHAQAKRALARWKHIVKLTPEQSRDDFDPRAQDSICVEGKSLT